MAGVCWKCQTRRGEISDFY
ncbi:Protein of unknown function [Gryllus bimaculatus]|nr:Protein of unknown function [Gryllus bimaculatus]